MDKELHWCTEQSGFQQGWQLSLAPDLPAPTQLPWEREETKALLPGRMQPLSGAGYEPAVLGLWEAPLSSPRTSIFISMLPEKHS